MAEPDALPSFEQDILPDMSSVDTGYSSGTSDYLSHLAAASDATFGNPSSVDVYRPLISSKENENQFRAALSAKEQIEQSRAFNAFIIDKIYQGTPANELESYVAGREAIANSDRSIMERRAAKWLVDQGLNSPERAAVIVNDEFNSEIVDTSKTDMRQEYVSTMLRLNTLQTRMAEKFKDQNIAENALDFAAMLLVPFHTTISAGLKDRQLETLGSKITRDVQNLWNMPFNKRMEALDQFENDLENNAIFGQNTLKAIEQIQNLINHRSEDEFLYDITEGLDALPFIGGIYKGLKTLKTISGAGLAAGSKDLSIARTVSLKEQEAVGKVLSPKQETEMIDNILPSSATPKLGPSDAEVQDIINRFLGEKPAGPTNKTLEEVALEKEWQKYLPTLLADAKKLGYDISADDVDPASLLQILKDTSVPAILRSDEQSNATLYAVKSLLNRFDIKTEIKYLIDHPDKYPLYDVEIADISGIPTVHMYLGQGESKLKGFTSEAAALAGAERLGLVKDFYSISDRSGEWFIKVSKEAGSTSFIQPTKEKPYVLPFIGKWLQGSATIMDEDALEGARLASLASSKFNKAITKSVDNIRVLYGKSKDSYNALMLEIQQTSKWKSMDELHDWYKTNYQRPPSEKEVKAYLATRHVYKFDYLVRNAAVHKELTRLNYEEVLFKPQYAKEIVGSDFPEVPNIKVGKVVSTTSIEPRLTKIVDMVEGGKVANIVDRAALKARLERHKDAVLVKLLTEDSQLGDYVIINKGDINIRPLRARVLNEIDGPHRIYDTGATGGFIKQQKIRFINGIQTFVSPRTHFAVNSGVDGKKFAEDYNIALNAFKTIRNNSTAIDKAKVDDIISSRTRFSGYDEMARAIKDGKMERTPFEFVRPGMTPIYKSEKLHAVEAIDPDFRNLSNPVADAIENGRMFYSERGVRLPHPKEGMATLLHPDEILKAAVNNVINTQSFNNYKVRQIEKWVREYGKYIVGMEDRPNIERFMYGQFDVSPTAKSAIKEPVLRSAEAQRLAIKRMLNQPGTLQSEAAKWRDHIVDYIEGKTGYGVAKASADILSSNPAVFARGVAYHAFLGMGDISQIAIQLSLLPGMLAVSPMHGAKSLTSYPFIRAALLNPKHDDFVAKLYTKFSFGTGFDAEAFKTLIKDIRKSGVDIIDGNIAELDNLTTSGNIPGFMSSMISKGVDAAAVAFKEGEKANRVIGFTIAWAENYAKTGKGLSTSEEFGTVARRGNTFASNMSKDGKAWWQEGWMSLPSQFMGNPVRVAELLLHPTAGFTNQEKLRFYSGLVLAYGPLLGAGGGAYEFFKQKYYEAVGEEPNEKTIRAFMGGLTGLLLPDTDISRLQPMGQAFPGSDFFDDKGVNLKDFLGPPGELGHRFFDSTLGSYKLHALITGQLRADMYVPTAADIVNDIFKNISSYNRIDKAITIAQTGKYYTNRGMLKQSDLSIVDAGMEALGFPPREGTEAYHSELFLEDIEKKVFKDAVEASQFLIKAFNAPENSVEFKKNLGYFEYIRDLNVDGDVSGNGGKSFTDAVNQLIRKHKAYNETVAIKFQRVLGRNREDLIRKQ